MFLHRPDPKYTGSQRARQNLWLAVRLTLVFIALIWLVFLVDHGARLDLARFGLRPRQASGLLGLVTTPLLHGGLAHIASNTLPLFVGGVALLFLYPNASLRALPAMYAGSSAVAWLFARPSVHIGASGLVYAILAFVFMSGLLRRDMRSVAVSLAIWFVYGSMLGGILPADTRISWELHVSGLFVGLVLAFVFRHSDRVPLKRYDWELEEDDDGDWSDHVWGGNGDDDWYDGPDESDGSNGSSNSNESDNRWLH